MNKRLVLSVFLFFVSAHSALGSVDVAINDVGLSIGNSKRFSGLRLNLQDRDVRLINGLNLTFWIPRDNSQAVYNGLSFGLVSLSGEEMNGVMLAGVGVRSESLIGMGVGLVGMSVEDRFSGIGIAGIGLGGGEFRGLFFGGIGLGAESLHGIAVGAVGVGASTFRGIGLGGIGIGADDIIGIVVGGVGVGGDRMAGIALGGVGVGGEELRGIVVGGVGVGGHDLRGLFAGLAGVAGHELHGIAAAGLLSKFEHAQGITTGAWNRASSDMIGLQIGILNTTTHLKGVQIGLLNYAANNPKGLRLLPIVNLHLSGD